MPSSKTAPHWLYLDPSSVDSTATSLATGQETMDRLNVVASNGAFASQSLRLTYFTARKTESLSQIRVWTGGTAAGATPTLIRFGLYSVATNGDITLVASTPNDTTLLATINTAYTKAFSAAYTVATGLRYAVGILVVSAAAMPSFMTASIFTNFAAELAQAPRRTATISAQADLPASVASGSLSNSSPAIYLALLP
jgi:hypothetical protein